MFASAAEKFGEELLLELAEPPADEVLDGLVVLELDDGVLLEVDGVLDEEDDDCATASVDSAKSTAAVVMLSVLRMDSSLLGGWVELHRPGVQWLCRGRRRSDRLSCCA